MRRISVVSLFSAVLITIPSTAAAQSVPSDPEADSPSGVIYEIPADRAREDAAPRRETPRRETQRSQGNGGTAGSEISIRSENNFGTSSDVPGADADGGRSDGTRKGAGASNGESESDGNSVADVASDAARSSAATTDGPSDGVVFPLIVVLVAAGILVGVVAGRRAFRGRQ
jgi:cobalamin biosynthesis Mg chelatase CobN